MTTNPLHLDVNEQIECAHTLASRFYADPVVFGIEKDRIFRRTWQLVGTLSQPCGEVNGVKRTISDPESYFTVDVVGEPVVVVRDKQGTLRAFRTFAATARDPLPSGAVARMFCVARITVGPTRLMAGSSARRMSRVWSFSTAAPWAWCLSASKPGSSSSSSIVI
jgi:hypothetical protein